MRSEHLLFSLIGLVFCALLFAIGCFFFLIPYVPTVEVIFKNLINGETPLISNVGIACMLFSVFILSCFALLSRRRYLLVRMGGVSIHQRVVREIATLSLAEIFPESFIECEALIKRKGKIEILANVGDLAENREIKLETIERTLAAAFLKCGIDKEFLLNVRFS